MNTRLFIVLVILAATSLFAGCKVAVVVVEGGKVKSLESGTCPSGTICIVEVNDTNFSETFTAIPKEGWQFEKWYSGKNFLCANSTSPECVVSSVEAAGYPELEALIDSSHTFYLMPVFKPGLDTITVDGKEWAQVGQFSGLSWKEIVEICPANNGGICAPGGKLNGYDMTGCVWASVDDVNALFNHYIGRDVLGPGPDFHISNGDSAWGSSLYDDGWLATHYIYDARVIDGWLRARERFDSPRGPGRRAIFTDHLGPCVGFGCLDFFDRAITEATRGINKTGNFGAWFYRAL